MKKLSLGVLLLVVLLVVVVNFSAVESRYQCDGEITLDGQSKPMTVFMKLHEYRWWVGLWSDSDGAVWVEIPNYARYYFGHVDAVEDSLLIYESPDTPLKGNHSRLSKSFNVGTGLGFFDGTCKSIKDER